MKIILVLALSLAAIPANAQNSPQCGPIAEVARQLKDKYSETPLSYGLINGRVVLELYVSPDGKTWTILAVGTDGKACFMSAGKDWVTEPKDEGKGT